MHPALGVINFCREQHAVTGGLNNAVGANGVLAWHYDRGMQNTFERRSMCFVGVDAAVAR